MKFKILLFSFLLFSEVLAQNTSLIDTSSLPEVFISATFFADTLQKIPASIAFLKRSDLVSNNGAIITSAINTLPGIYMQQGALNTNRITIRGIGSRTQYGTDRVKAYINGIPISSAAGSTVIEDIDPAIIESAEIIKGPVSSMYGSGLGGTIFLQSKNLNRNHAQLNNTIGSFGYLKNSLGLAIANEKSGLQINYTQVKSNGYRDNSDFSRKTLTASGQVSLSNSTAIKIFSNIVRLNAQIPSSLNYMDFKNNPSSADRNWAASMGYESYDKWLGGIILEHTFTNKFETVTSIFGQFRDGYEPRPFNILDEEQLGIGARTKFSYNYSLFGKPSKLVFGAEFLIEDYSVDLYENHYRDFPGEGSVKGDKINSNNQTRSYINSFVAHQWSVANRFLLDLGININSTMYNLKDTFLSDSINQSGSYQYKIIPSPRIAASYEIVTGKNLYASISHGFSTPGVEETLNPTGHINTELLPETGINFEIGIKSSWFKNKLSVEAAIFAILIENLLVAQRVAEDQYIGINAGKTQHAGLEISFEYTQMITKKWLIRSFFSAAINNFKFQEFTESNQDFSGNRITGVPFHTINLGLNSELVNGFSFRINLLSVGKIPLNDSNSGYSKQYDLLNVNMGYTFEVYKKLTLETIFGINNLTYSSYSASVLPNAIGFGTSAPRYYYPGEARNYYAGLSFLLDF